MKTIYIIGRESDCDICLWDETNEVSRHHAQLRIDSKGKYWLMDTSTNGTYVNGLKITPNQEVLVSRKDDISFAHIENLDWSLIPRKKHIGLIFGISTAVIVLIAIIVGTSIYVYNHSLNFRSQDATTDMQSTAPSQIGGVTCSDSISTTSDDSAEVDKPKELIEVKKTNPKGIDKKTKKSENTKETKEADKAEEAKPTEESSEAINAIY